MTLAWLTLAGCSAMGALSSAATARVRSVRAARRESLARITHELRGPLTAARLGLEPAARGDGLSPLRARAIELELERASLVADDLGALAFRDAADALAPISWQEVDLAQLLEHCAEGAQGMAEAAGGRVEAHWSGQPGVVLGDRVRLAQAIGNLLANAIEHGGGAVCVRGSAAGELARIEIADGGSGLPAPVGELAHRAKRGRGTRGRGLAIAREVVERHRGRLVTVPSGHGARLVIELPVSGRGLAGEA